MTPTLAASLVLAAAYLVGAVPFGYVVGRLRGVDLFREGSGNIGATNAGRVLGRTWGVVVFLLDFAKGALPVALAVPLAERLTEGASTALGPPDVLRVGAAALAFLGHLFPIYLGFRGGKGVATGAGAVAVLAPGPTALAVLYWVVVLLATRAVSAASLAAVGVLVAARLLGTPNPFAADRLPVTLFVLVGGAFVVVKHRSNVARLARGTESLVLADGPRRRAAIRVVHLLAVGLWFGGAAFFNFGTAPAVFASFRQVAHGGPSDRTAYQTIVPPDATTETRNALASALAGSAVGPVFPVYFGMQATCAGLALVTALSFRRDEPGRRVHRRRVSVLALAAASVVVAWPVSSYVSELRLLRFDPTADVAAAARAAFAPWHLVSLLLSLVTVGLAGVGLALAAWLPGAEGRGEGTVGPVGVEPTSEGL